MIAATDRFASLRSVWIAIDKRVKISYNELRVVDEHKLVFFLILCVLLVSSFFSHQSHRPSGTLMFRAADV